MGSDSILYTEQEYWVVSIHAPVWGATDSGQVEPVEGGSVSIHAPVWGATLERPRYFCRIYVSIHAPVWGATTC